MAQPTSPSRPAKRRQRPRGVLPAGFDWRPNDHGGARPRWLPSPTRRAQGWSPVDLAVVSGGEKTWMSQGQAIDRCKAINAAVQAWTLRSQPVPADMTAFAPPGAVDGSRPSPAQVLSGRAIGALQDAWLASPRFSLPRAQGGLSPSTIADYKSKLTVLNQALVRSADEALIAALRALPIDTLAAPEEEGDDFPLEQAYHWLVRERGHPMAHGVMAVASAWLTWCWRKKRIKSMAANPVALVDRARPAGRIRIATPHEVRALLASADALNLGSIADAVLLALDLGWSLGDILRLDWRRVVQLPDPHTGAVRWVVTRVARGKTGVVSSDIPFMALGQASLARIRARTADAVVTPTHLVVREPSPRNRTGVWTPRAFNDAWRAVRDRAAADAPTLLPSSPDADDGLDFMDLRDTFITLAREAELTVEQTVGRSLHKNSARVLQVWEKHYGASTPRMAAAGARKMGAHMAETGWTAILSHAV